MSRPGGKVKVWYQTRYPGDDAVAARVLADLEDKVWGPLTKLMGHGPLPDDGLPNNGGDGLFDVYIMRLDAEGQAPAYEPICQYRPSYLLIDGATKILPFAIVHEFMHAIIWATPLMSCESPEYRWLNEATATWAADFISHSYDTQQAEQACAEEFLNFPEYSLQTLGWTHENGAYLWPFYLARTYQPELIRTIRDATVGKNSLAAIDGIDALLAQSIITEIGTDVSAWPTVKHFSSWLSLAPLNDVSGGKVLRRRTKKTQNKANLAFRLAAQSLHLNDSAMGAFYRRMKARHGPAKATTATAHKLARTVYFMLKNRTDYVDPGVTYYDQQYRDRTIRNLKRKAASLGMELVPVAA